eukprot:3168097-Lingulodinium_polyedra.AAC.1
MRPRAGRSPTRPATRRASQGPSPIAPARNAPMPWPLCWPEPRRRARVHRRWARTSARHRRGSPSVQPWAGPRRF